MKKILLLLPLVLCGIIASSQITPNGYETQQDLNQQSPNIAKNAYLTNLTGKTIQAYPNPAIDQVTVQYVSTTDRAVITIVSTDGRIVQQRTVMPNTLQTQLNVGTLSKGVYIVKFDNSKGDVRTLQLVKN